MYLNRIIYSECIHI